MMKSVSFSGIAIVSCGTLSPELNYLKKEGFLEYSDWMGIPIQPYSISLDRFKSLLSNAAHQLDRN